MPTTSHRYDPVAVTLHWLIAVLILVMLIVGFTMENYPMSLRFTAFNLHKATGIAILTLSVFRLIWRLLNPPPALPATMPFWEKAAAHLSHWALYAFIIAMPLTGWIMVSATPKYPIIFFWLGEAPFLPMPKAIDTHATHEWFEGAHYYLALGGIALILVHILAALKHHFIDRDIVLIRMLPRFLTRK